MVYFIQGKSLHLIKIGYVERFDLEGARKRMATFQIGSPDQLVLVAVVDGGQSVETQLHRRFRRHCAHGEWFEPTPELLNLIVAYREAYARKVLADLRTCGFNLRIGHSLDSSRCHLIVSPFSRLTSAWQTVIRFVLPELLNLVDQESCPLCPTP